MKKNPMVPVWVGKNKRAVGLLRVSSKGQDGNTSKRTQIKAIKEYCRKHGLVLVKVIEITESAKDADLRDKYQAAHEWANRSDIRHRVYYILDREARNLTDTESAEKDVRRDKYVLHYVAEDKVLHRDSPDTDFLMRDYQAVNNKHYSRALSTKVRTATKQKAEDGDFPGRWTPLGYKHQKRKDKRGHEKRRGSIIVVSDKRDVEQVQREFELRAEMFADDPKRVRSLADIRERIIMEGLVPPDKIKTYHTSTIHRRLTNKFYDCRFDWNDIEYPGNQPRFISQEVFWRVQETFGIRNPYQKKSDGIFGGGWLKCAVCGCHVVYDPKDKVLKNGDEVTYHHYHCTNGKKMHATSAGMRVHEEKLWEQISEAVGQISITEDFAKQILDAINETHLKAQTAIKREMEGFRSGLADLEDEEDRIYTDYRKGVLDEDGHNRQVAKVREQRQEFTRQLELANLKISNEGMMTVKTTLELATNAKLLWNRRTPVERKTMLCKLLSNQVLDGSTVRYEMKKPFRILSEMASNLEWRRERDSNSRAVLPAAPLARECLRPLGHLSGEVVPK